MKKIVSIFTPTYNRSKNLVNLYTSLKKQTMLNFNWIIVNDGSTDDTESRVNEFINENKINIIYYKQKNQGKHIAHNKGVELCETELFFCVDSDDILVDNAVEIINNLWDVIRNKEDISGLIAYKANFDRNKIGNDFPQLKVATLQEVYSNGKTGDTALIFKTKVLKKFSFPQFENENFLRETILYDMIDEEYKLFIVREILYLCEYREDGLSYNATKLEMSSPKGAAMFRLRNARKSKSVITKIINYASYIFFSQLGQDEQKAKQTLGTIKYYFLYPVTFIVKYRYKLILKGRKI